MKKTFFRSLVAAVLALSVTACQTAPTNPAVTTDSANVTTSVNETTQTDAAVTTTEEPVATETPTTTEAPVTLENVSIAAMKGPTAMGLAKYTSELDESAEPKVTYTIQTMPDEVAAGLIKGELDLACIPANLAATVYNRSEGKVQVAAINVLNVLYFATNNVPLNSLEELEGKTIYATGKGATPDVILQNLLAKAGLTIGTDVNVEFRSEATEVAALLQAEEGAIALLQEPFLSSVTMQNEQIEAKLNVSDLWAEYMGEDSQVVTGVLVVRKEFAEANKAWFDQFLEDYTESAAWVSENPAEAAQLIAVQEIIGAPVAERAIPKIGLNLITGAELKSTLAPYLEVLAESNPALVGGTLPADDFYYQK